MARSSRRRCSTLLLVAGLISAVGGALLALAQDDLKRLLAYDTISQMGVLCVGHRLRDREPASPARPTT